MSYLLDTVVVSELSKRRGTGTVRDWIAAHEADVWISWLSFGEIERGIVRAGLRDPVFALNLQLWEAALRERYSARILPLTLSIALIWGKISGRLGRSDVDLQLAATALIHDMTVVTRNVRHFAPAGVRVVNPWEAW